MDSIEATDGLEADAPDEARRFRIVALVAAVPFAAFLLPQLALAGLASTYRQMYEDMGGPVPAASAFAVRAVSSAAFPLVLIVLDIAVFWLMYRLAKRYWIGLLFAPIFYILAINALVVWLMYLPLLQVVTLVQ